jgi:hypothetical protein
MSNLSVVLSASLTVADTSLSPAPTIVSRSFNNPTFAATTVFYDPFFVSPGTVNLPAATVYVVRVRNLNGAGNLTVAFTPVGGGAASSFVLIPGAEFNLFEPANTGGGITALSLTGSGSADVLVAG